MELFQGISPPEQGSRLNGQCTNERIFFFGSLPYIDYMAGIPLADYPLQKENDDTHWLTNASNKALKGGQP